MYRSYAVERAVSQVVDRDSERDEPRRSRRRRPRREYIGDHPQTPKCIACIQLCF